MSAVRHLQERLPCEANRAEQRGAVPSLLPLQGGRELDARPSDQLLISAEPAVLSIDTRRMSPPRIDVRPRLSHLVSAAAHSGIPWFRCAITRAATADKGIART